MIIEFSDSGYLLHLTCGAIGPLGTHDTGYTLELNLQPHWLVLDLLVGYGPGVEYHALLQFGMCIVAFPA